MRRTNLSDLDVQYDESDPEGYRAGMARFGPSIGAAKIGCSLYELPAGQSICPYHYEYPDEEWLVVLDGRPTLRDPDGEHELKENDIVCFPAGADGAHKVTNRTEEPVRILMLSTRTKVAVAFYPDSEKVGIWPPGKLFRLSDAVDYWDGEI